jgi:hypothetical protein
VATSLASHAAFTCRVLHRIASAAGGKAMQASRHWNAGIEVDDDELDLLLLGD